VLKVLNGNNWKAVLLLSIVVPVGLLATFKLTGLLGEPATIAETITLEPVEWEFERPYSYVVFDKLLRVPYSNNYLSGTFDFIVIDYAESVNVGFGDRVTLIIRLNLTGANSDVFIENVCFCFHEIYQGSRLYFQRSNVDFQFINLSLAEIVDGFNGENNLKAFISLAGLNHPNNVYLHWTTLWTLHSLNTQDHELSATYEVTYYNGTAYNKIIQPFKVQIKGGTKP